MQMGIVFFGCCSFLAKVFVWSFAFCRFSINCSKMRLSLVPINLSSASLNPNQSAHDKSRIGFFPFFLFCLSTVGAVEKCSEKYHFDSSRIAKQRLEKRVEFWKFCVNCLFDGKHGIKPWYTSIHVRFISPPPQSCDEPKRMVNAEMLDSINQNHSMFAPLSSASLWSGAPRCYRMHSGVKNASINLHSPEKWVAHLVYLSMRSMVAAVPARQWHEDKPQRRKSSFFNAYGFGVVASVVICVACRFSRRFHSFYSLPASRMLSMVACVPQPDTTS